MAKISKIFALVMTDPQGDDSIVYAEVNGNPPTPMIGDQASIGGLTEIAPQLVAFNHREVRLVAYDFVEVSHVFEYKAPDAD